MKFNSAREVEQICYEIRLSDFPRGQNRARINDLFNGFPPYSEEEARTNNIVVNVNFLEGTSLAHDARTQFYQAFLKPGRFFTLQTDFGAAHKRVERGNIVSTELNRIAKNDLDYVENFRSKFAQNVLHGVGPSAWRNDSEPFPEPVGIEDVGVPAKTLLTMRNLPFFYLYRSYTYPELVKLTRGKNVDPGWNMKLVNRCLEWIDRETMALMGSNWPEVWAPEKAAERIKGDGGFYCGDQVPTIDTFDFYFWYDDGKSSGWRRRIILDSWSTPQSSGGIYNMSRKGDDLFNSGDFLYTSRNRNVADDWKSIVTFQFADLSSVAPFQYHSVRGLGFLLYATLHLQNRLRCKFSESVFEALLMYFRVKGMDEAERALKVQLANRGFIDETLQFIPAAERYQVNSALVELGINQNESIIGKHMSSFVQPSNFSQDRTEKTKFQVMAELNASTTLVSAALNQAYIYQRWEYNEVVRRFMNRNSDNPQVNKFRANCLRKGVPESMLIAEKWAVEPERVMGAGNKTLELAIAEQLMQWRNLYDPEPQRQILRDVTLAVTDDPARAESLVPEQPVKITDSVHDAELAFGTLMSGNPVSLKTGMNHIEYVNTLLGRLAMVIQKCVNNGNMATPEQIEGMSEVVQHIKQHIEIIGQDPEQKPMVKKYNDALSKLQNEIKGFVQRLQEKMKQQAQQGPAGPDPKTMAKVQEIQLTGQAKRQANAQARAQKQAERRVEFEMEIQRDAAKHNLEMAKNHQEHNANMFREGLSTAHDLQLQKQKAKAQLEQQNNQSNEE